MDLFSLADGSWGLKIVRIAIIIAGILIIQTVVHRTIGRVIAQAVKGEHFVSNREELLREKTLKALLTTAVTVVLWVIGSIVILQELSVNIAALATGAGLIGVLVGFGAQSLIKDFLNGVLIILENQYKIGDIITINDRSGIVEDITIRVTRIRDLDGSVYFVPNGEITTVRNMTLEFSSVLVEVGIGYNNDVNEAEKVINEVGQSMAEDDHWKDSIIEPIKFLQLDSFGSSRVNLKAVGRVKPATQWDVATEFRRRLKKAFEKHGIDIPLPQRVLHDAKPRAK
ncbi:MAG: mechanosensitive ion channel family protein [Candidatus Saccharimonadales bacterium]